MNPLDLPGPAFLAVWLVGAVLVGVITAAAIAALVGHRRSPDDPEIAAIAGALSPSEVAALAGGIERVVETSVVALHHRGALRVTTEGLALGAPADKLTTLDRHVLDQIRCGNNQVAGIVTSADVHRWALDEQLRAHGLLASGNRFALCAIAYAWLLLGIAKVGVGLARDRPVGILVMLLVLGAVATTVIRMPRRSAAGNAVLAARTDLAAGLGETALASPGLLTADELAAAFAVFGATGVTTAVVMMLPSHARALAAAASSSSAGSSCGGSCSSGCGSGCGGGCGGCS